MQTELIDVAMKAIAAHVAAPYQLRIRELESQLNSGFTPEALAQETRAEDAESEVVMLRDRLKQAMDHTDELEKKLEQARKIQGGMQKKNDALIAQISAGGSYMITHPQTGKLMNGHEAVKEITRLLNTSSIWQNKADMLEKENGNLRGELSGKRFAAKSKLHKVVVNQPSEPETRPHGPSTGVGHGGLVLNANDMREWDHQ